MFGAPGPTLEEGLINIYQFLKKINKIKKHKNSLQSPKWDATFLLFIRVECILEADVYMIFSKTCREVKMILLIPFILFSGSFPFLAENLTTLFQNYSKNKL